MSSKRLFQRFLSICAALAFVSTFHLCLIGSVHAEAAADSRDCCQKESSKTPSTPQKMLCCEDLDARASLVKLAAPTLMENRDAQEDIPALFATLKTQQAGNFFLYFNSGPPELVFTAFLLTPSISSQAPPLR
jgi:hypothetical protein